MKLLCSKCRSEDVVEDFSNAAAVRLGAPSVYVCKKCGYRSYIAVEVKS
jgi:hypothetical protein